MTKPERRDVDAALVVRSEVRRVERRRRRLLASLAAVDAERLALFRQARELDPPITWAELGRIVGQSKVAILQVVKRAGIT